MSGTLDVLSVGKGHLRLTITEGNEEEAENARRIIEDMLARGASIFVEREDGSTRRVKKFDPKRMVYLIDDVPEGQKPTPAARKKIPKKAVPVSKASATVVGRSAGG